MMLPLVSGLMFSCWSLFVWYICFSKPNPAKSDSYTQSRPKSYPLPESVSIPRFIQEKINYRNNLRLISKLTDPLRMLVSRIPDQKNITKAIENTRDEITDPHIARVFNEYLKDAAIGGSVVDALQHMKNRVKLRKFHIFVDTLVQTHNEGFTSEALNALEKAVEAMEFDLKIIEKVKIKNAIKKKNLYSALGVSWLFPFILSMANTGQTNTYLHTVQGRILIFFYVVCSIYIFIKGEEYLNLRLEEL